eukprot:5514803-Pleurochrysis_carterae.AAC.1
MRIKAEREQAAADAQQDYDLLASRRQISRTYARLTKAAQILSGLRQKLHRVLHLRHSLAPHSPFENVACAAESWYCFFKRSLQKNLCTGAVV